MRCKLVAAAGAVSMSLAAVACSASAAAASMPATGRSQARQPLARYVLASRSVRLVTRSAAGSSKAAPPPAALDRRFGTGCTQLPRVGGAGAPRGLRRLPVVTAMAQAPTLSDFVHAIGLAGLAGKLNKATALTVFAPDNAAFQQLGSGNLQALLATKSDLTAVLQFQIVAGRVRPAELARQRVLTTISGTKIYPARAAPSYFVNNAWITCGNLSTTNATVYIVSQVVIPATQPAGGR